MPRLKLRFSGLCLHRPVAEQVDVLDAVPALGQMSRDGLELLTRHQPQLWVQRTTTAPGTSRNEVSGSPKNLCFIKTSTEARCGVARIYDLRPGESLHLVNPSGPALNWTQLTAPRLRALNGQVGDHRPRPAAAFRLTHGTWNAGPQISVEWAVSGTASSLVAWHEVVVDFESSPIEIASSHPSGGWRIHPDGNEVIVWVGSHPVGHHGHANQHDDFATHFKWFYEHVELSSVPGLLEHPQLKQNLPQCDPPCGGAGGPTSTAFCPDTQYP